MSPDYDGLDLVEPKDALRLHIDHKEREQSKNSVQARRCRRQFLVDGGLEIGR